MAVDIDMRHQPHFGNGQVTSGAVGKRSRYGKDAFLLVGNHAGNRPRAPSQQRVNGVVQAHIGDAYRAAALPDGGQNDAKRWAVAFGGRNRMVVLGNNLRLVGHVGCWIKIRGGVFQSDIIVAVGAFNFPGAVDLWDRAAPPDVYPDGLLAVGIHPVHTAEYIFQIVLAVDFQGPIDNV
ncbi:hypothetical protein [Fodinibius salsisoli]|uniref:Uncharacterized protein n=1 Tax=Fodinibius salsisoli TaxID=2820877 RepID=A0ABT3PT58_9BACT|nr:hypothetical protein [Fodinibius salsisoli]MCW9709054.1 hypothetical protein [Fodinibius salsisoli]